MRKLEWIIPNRRIKEKYKSLIAAGNNPNSEALLAFGIPYSYEKGQRSTFLMRMEIVNQVAKRQKKKKTYFMRGESFFMNDIQTTGGLYTAEIKKTIMKNISTVFNCKEDEIYELVPVQAGMTNIVLSFKLNGGKYVYRHPGLGSDALVERGRETIMQKIVEDAGIDTTLIAMDVDEGWRIGRFVEHYDFNYKDLNDMVRAVMLFRRLHEAPCHVRWNFDVIKKAEGIKRQINPDKYGLFPDFEAVKDRIYKLAELAETDGIKKCNIHGDARDVNFLINKEEIYLIDWEYGGYGDPGFDIGSYVCGGQHTLADIDRILFTYYRHKPTETQRRHFYAYMAITGWFFMHWTMLKQSKGQVVGIHKEQWYHYAKNFSLISLPMYGIDVDKEQYEAALEAAKTCTLEDLSFMNKIVEERSNG